MGLPSGVKWCKSDGVKEKLTPHFYIFLGCIGLSRGVKWCKSEGMKNKLTPHSYIFLVCQGGVKRCKSSGVLEKLPPNSYIVVPHLTDQKDVRVGINLFFTPSLLYHFTPLEAQCIPKRCKSFELHFPKKNPPIATPLLLHFERKNSTRALLTVLHLFVCVIGFCSHYEAGHSDHVHNEHPG